MHNFLVEEHTTHLFGAEGDRVPYRVLVHAESPQAAFTVAAIHYQRTYANMVFVFAPEELEEVEPGYLSAAADGSSIWYEVRDLGINLPETDLEVETKWQNGS